MHEDHHGEYRYRHKINYHVNKHWFYQRHCYYQALVYTTLEISLQSNRTHFCNNDMISGGYKKSRLREPFKQEYEDR